MDDSAFRSLSGLVPIFPLPSVVFFPKTVLPLHIFEPRYRQMVRDAIDGEGLIAVSLLLPGWESDYAESPGFHGVGTIGRIQELDRLGDGRFNLRLVGLCRASFGEIVRSRPYRVARIRPRPETAVDEESGSVRRDKIDLLVTHSCLLRALDPEESPGIVCDERISFESAVNGTCANLPIDPAMRQSLLEEDDLRERHRRATALVNGLLERVLRLDAQRRGEDDGFLLH